MSSTDAGTPASAAAQVGVDRKSISAETPLSEGYEHEDTTVHDAPSTASRSQYPPEGSKSESIANNNQAGQAASATGIAAAPIRTRDFYFLPIPSARRFRPDKPFEFSLAINYLFAFTSTFTVANLYYCQPLLVQYSESFNVSYAATTHVPTLLQGGYAFGLLFISPLGDMLRRRALILLLVTISTGLTVGLATTRSFEVFQALNFLVAIFTVVPQIMMPLAADMAPKERRAQSMAIVLSGLLLGVLVARVLSGIIAEFSTWRNVYYMSIGVQGLVWVMLYFALPDYPPKNADISYFQVLKTMIGFLFTNPVLVQGSILSGIGSLIFADFWVVLTFLLSDDPYRYNTLVIGLFGLVGMVGVSVAPFVGKLIDRLVPWMGVACGNSLLLVSQLLLLGGSRVNIAFVVIAILFLDIGQQLQQVSNQSRIYSTNPAAGSRLNAVYIIGLFIGQLIGSSAVSKVFLEKGARANYAVCCGGVGLNFLVLLARGPLKSNTKWIGWGKKNDWALIKRKETLRVDVEKNGTTRQDSSPATAFPDVVQTRSDKAPPGSR